MRIERMMTTTPNLDKLTNLLASENITVEHRKVPTASFDVKSRVLTLPLWMDMSKELYHLLILHEVGHALYTPEDKWVDAVRDDIKLKGYVNVIEDARIERNMKNKYPGSRRDFSVGYKEIYDRDIFGVKGKPTEKMNFIDRVNLYFKLGSSMDITFSPEEMEYVIRAETLTTFDDAVALSTEMLAYARETAETAENHDFGGMSDELDEFGDWDGDGDFEESSDNGNTTDSNSEDEGSNPSSPANSEKSEETDADSEGEGEADAGCDDDISDDDDDDDYSPSGGSRGGDGWDDQITATTDENLEKNMIDQLVDASAIPTTYIDLDRSYNYKKHIVPNKFIRESIRSYRSECRKDPIAHAADQDRVKEWDANTETRYSNFISANKKNVMYLVKEFEMKKAADQYSRSRDAKTGVVDPTKLHSYKYSDTIFKRISVLPDAKNHGLVMLTDFSGSMAENMNGTIEQLINLVMFCRRVNIPHRVYGFTDAAKIIPMKNASMYDEMIDKIESCKMKKEGQMLDSSHTCLLELFSEKMNNAEFVEMSKYMLDFGGEMYNFYGHRQNRRWWDAPKFPVAWRSFIFNLGGTPLNETLVYCRDLINDFRKETSSQIVNFVCLTDGESSAFNFNHEYLVKLGHYDDEIVARHSSRNMTMRDPITKLSIKMKYRDRRGQTEFMLNVIRKSCSVNIINFLLTAQRGYPYDLITMVGDSRKNAGKSSWIDDDEVKEIKRQWRKDKHMSIPNTRGFDEVHVIMGGAALETESTSLDDIKVGDKRGAMARAFIKANAKRKTSRVILSKFIDKIAA